MSTKELVYNYLEARKTYLSCSISRGYNRASNEFKARVSFKEYHHYRKMYVSEHKGITRNARNIGRIDDFTPNVRNGLKVFIFDIETTPMLSYHWGRYNCNIPFDHTLVETHLLCWSGKWLYRDQPVFGDCLTPEEARNHDDSRISESLWKCFDEADVVIAYNGTKADIPWATGRFIANGLPVPTPYKVIDPYISVKKHFGLSCNKLDYVAKLLDCGRKLETDFQLWVDCFNGVPEALDRMFKYNLQDTEVLEEIYLELLPYLRGIPNLSNILGADCCPVCGSTKPLEPVAGKFYYTKYYKYPICRCPDCGSIVRSRDRLKIETNRVNCSNQY